MLTFIGIIGASLILLAYYMAETGKWAGVSHTYNAVNLLGAILLLVNAVAFRGYPFIALNAVWATIAVSNLLKPQHKRTKRGT